MQSRLLTLVCLSLAFVACGSADTSTPMAACNSVVSAACNKESSCNSLGQVTVAECITEAEAAASCSTYACPAGSTYNSGAVSQCINDINNASCPVNAAPASCDMSLFCTGG